MTDNDIPMWALDKAAQAAEIPSWYDASQFCHAQSGMLRSSIRAHAALIAKHEQPPVDPDLAEARECLAIYFEEDGFPQHAKAARDGSHDASQHIKLLLVRLQREKEGKRA